jgi:lipoprotein NlpI
MTPKRALRAYSFVAVAALLLLATLTQASQPTPEELAQVAAKKQEVLTRRVEALTGEIESGRLEGKDLADIYRLRGVAYSQLDEEERAVQDFSSAIELEQVNVEYYADRAIGYLRLREFAKANTDLDMALGLNPKYPPGHREKGRLSAYQWEWDNAARSFALAMENDQGMGAAYGAIWLQVAAMRAGLEVTTPLPQLAAALPPSQWPVPIVQMLIGKISPEEAIAAADNRNPAVYLEQKCEVYFYAGEHYMAHKDIERAHAAFEAAIATGVTEFLEYDWARRELELIEAAKK